MIAPEARILGEIRHIAPPSTSPWFTWTFHVALALELALIGALASVFLPKTSRSLREVAARDTGAALLVGVGILLGLPIAALFAIVSVIAAPLGLFALYVYLFCLPIGYLVSSMALSDRLYERWRPASETRGWASMVTLALVLVSLGGLTSLPVLGWLLGAALSAIGMGSVALYGRRSFHAGRPSGRDAARLPLESEALPETG